MSPCKNFLAHIGKRELFIMKWWMDIYLCKWIYVVRLKILVNQLAIYLRSQQQLAKFDKFNPANFHCKVPYIILWNTFIYIIDCCILFYSDYLVLSEFTLALFEDSGWYKANYTALNNLQQNPLQWGKGKALYTYI